MLEVKKHGMLMELPATHSVCSLTRSLLLTSPSSPTFVCSSSVLFDSLVPARLALRANLRLLYLKGPAFSIVSSVVNSTGFGLMQDWSKPRWAFIGLGR